MSRAHAYTKNNCLFISISILPTYFVGISWVFAGSVAAFKDIGDSECDVLVIATSTFQCL